MFRANYLASVICLSFYGLVCIVQSELAFAQDDAPVAPENSPPLLASPPPSAAADGAVKPAGHEAPISDAEKITALQRALQADQESLTSIEAVLANPMSEYHQAEEEFEQLDARLAELKKKQQDSPDDTEIKSEIEKLQSQWKLARERFDLAIQERKTIQQKAATLTQKIQQEQQRLDKLTGAAPSASATPAAPVEEKTPTPATTSTSADEAAARPPPSPARASILTPLPMPAVGSGVAKAKDPPPAPPSATAAPTGTNPPSPEKPNSKELTKAMEVAQQKQVVAEQAEQEVQSVVERMVLMRTEIQLEQQLLATIRKKADVAHQTERQLQEEYESKLRAAAAPEALRELRTKLSQARQRFTEARNESRERVNRIDELQSRLAALQSEQIVALKEAERTGREAETAQKTVETLRNPFTARNLLQWLIDHGPRIGVILIGMLLALWFARTSKRRLIDVIVTRGGLGKRVDRENRAKTLVGVFENAATVAILVGGLLMVLDTVGAPITTLMGGAAVFGLAIAFGAQSLIKDYFYGFMILLEQQYTINDVIKIGDISGQVERITLRITVLRDLEGRVHFLPHGVVMSVTNMTHGWSRALFELGVAYKEDTDHVIDIIEKLGQEMRSDPQFGPLLLEDLTMLGVDAFSESAIVIKFFIKTQPLKQWEVKREFLRRIKRTFDEQGIEIPFPHRTVYHRHAGVENVEARGDEAERLRKSA